jgi:hypothetical protein
MARVVLGRPEKMHSENMWKVSPRKGYDSVSVPTSDVYPDDYILQAFPPVGILFMNKN